MRGVADLIELCFARELDQGGQGILNEMRLAGRLGLVANGLLALGLLRQPWTEGFVCLAAGRVVGCVNTAPMEKRPGTWLIVNVAVHPNHRRQGLARALMQASLGYIVRAGGRTAWLEVDADNTGAIQLYEQLGFTYLTTRTLWTRAAHLALPLRTPPAFTLRPRRAEEWEAHLALARAVRPDGLEWHKPLRPADFQTTVWRWVLNALSEQSEEHWVVPAPDPPELLGSLTVRRNWADGNRLIVLTRPDYRQALTRPLLVHGLHRLGQAMGIIRIEHPTDDEAARTALRELEFQPARAVRWMQKELK